MTIVEESIFTVLKEFNMISMCFRIGLALLFGAVIGVDRSRSGSPAGIKTHSLVCMGAALVMLTSEYCMIHFGMSDITRMGAQVISGIGFLGAGTILITGNDRIKGLTSAASIWFSACVGLTIGIGFYEGAIVASVLEILVFRVFSKAQFQPAQRKLLHLYIEYTSDFEISTALRALQKENFSIVDANGDMFKVFSEEKPYYNALVTVEVFRTEDLETVKTLFHSLPGIHMVQEVR